MLSMDRDEQDVQDAAIVEASMPDAHHVRRLLKQGFRQFRLGGARGPKVWVQAFNLRHGTATIERSVLRRKGKSGQRLKKPRLERIEETVTIAKLHLAVNP